MTDYATKGKAASLNQAAHAPRSDRSLQSGASDASAWVGWTVFAAIMLVLMGGFNVIEGLVALFDDGYYQVDSSGLAVDVSYTTWGWVQILVGCVFIAAGVSLFAGRMWARILGTAVAALSAIVNLGFMPAYPLWSTLMLVVDVFIILALTVHGSEMTDTY